MSKTNWTKIDWKDDNGIRSDGVFRPVEIMAFYNISRDAKIFKLYGKRLKYTEFEKKIFELDLNIQTKEYPKDGKYVLKEISKRTGYSVEFIKATLRDIDNKIYMRDKLKMNPYPIINKIEVKK